MPPLMTRKLVPSTFTVSSCHSRELSAITNASLPETKRVTQGAPKLQTDRYGIGVIPMTGCCNAVRWQLRKNQVLEFQNFRFVRLLVSKSGLSDSSIATRTGCTRYRAIFGLSGNCQKARELNTAGLWREHLLKSHGSRRDYEKPNEELADGVRSLRHDGCDANNAVHYVSLLKEQGAFPRGAFIWQIQDFSISKLRMTPIANDVSNAQLRTFGCMNLRPSQRDIAERVR